MLIRAEEVHVHCLDEQRVVDEYRKKGYVLYKRQPPAIVAQPGFMKLLFLPAEDVPHHVSPKCSIVENRPPARIAETINAFFERVGQIRVPTNSAKH